MGREDDILRCIGAQKRMVNRMIDKSYAPDLIEKEMLDIVRLEALLAEVRVRKAKLAEQIENKKTKKTG